MKNVFKRNIQRSKARSIISIFLLTFLISSVGYLTYCQMSSHVAFIGNYAFLKILTSSMEPKIPTGSYILVEKATADDITIDDIMVFTSRDPSIFGKMNTHRVIDVLYENGQKTFVTKGDNNNRQDSLTTKAKDVDAKFVKVLPVITKIGYVVTNKYVFFIVILIPSFLLIVLCVVDVAKKAKQVEFEILVADEVEKMKMLDKSNYKEDK